METKTQKKTKKLLNQRNKYRAGLGFFKENEEGHLMKRKLTNEAKMKKKIVEEVRNKKNKQIQENKDIQQQQQNEDEEHEEEIRVNRLFDEGEKAIQKFEPRKRTVTNTLAVDWKSFAPTN